MPAPNPYVLYQFESALESAFVDVVNYFLAQASISGVSVQGTEDDGIDGTPRIELEASISAIVPQWAATGQATAANPKQVPVARFFSVAARVVVTKGDPAQSLKAIVGVLRYAASAGAKGFNSSNLPYHQILELYDVSGFPGVPSDDKSQQSLEVTFGGQIAIRNEAWPSTP